MNSNSRIKPVLRYLSNKGVKFFEMVDFYLACPYEVEEIQSQSRKQDLKEWRQVACVWAYFSNCNMKKAEGVVNRHHTTITHSFKEVTKSIEGHNPPLKEKLNLVISQSKKNNLFNDKVIKKTDDTHQNELIALALMDNKLNELKA